MNLKNPGKKLYFKIIIGTIIGAGIALWIFMMYECRNYIQDDFERSGKRNRLDGYPQDYVIRQCLELGVQPC